MLSVVGGFAASLFAIFSVCMQSYQLFAYEKSVFKHLFFEDSNEPEQTSGINDGEEGEDTRRSYSYPGIGQELTPRSQMRKQLSKESTDFSMNYFSSLLVTFLSNVCCCLVNRFDTKQYEGGWYRRSKQRLRRLGLAREKLSKELDILHFVREIRLLELLKRTSLNRR